ncbi:MAG: acetyl-CoA carboxylase carboxyl transferase subunit alpha [Salibacteraceae bacterium]|jgi:acetyl-CoA carboxylase carboxyl transferase subunit alpha
MAAYLDFEQPIADLEEQLKKAMEIAEVGQVDASQTINDLKKKINETKKDVYAKLTPWQRVQVSRHPERPYTLDYITGMTDGNFVELHGDRNVKDDKAIVGGLGSIDGKSYMFIGQQKGINTKMRQYRNFGMANPEGYRKALRLMKLAEKFNKPIITLIDTPGAYPGLEAEERGQGEAIAKNLIEMFQLRVPVMCIIIGEGASGGALGIGIGDKVMMLENTWYSVISPESCSSILWRSWEHKEKAADALKLTPKDMLKNKLIDGVIKEPAGGAHSNKADMVKRVKREVIKTIAALEQIPTEELIDLRIKKFCDMGAYAK